MFDFLLGRDRNGDRSAVADEKPAPPQPPRIGLALSGGLARGFAHIGFIRALEARGIVPDVVAGTSIGALVGGVYAAGHLDGFEAWARKLTRRSLFGYMDVSFSGSGLIHGERLADDLAAEIGDVTIESLPKRFAAIATEIGTGHEIWLTRGKLREAIRASYTLPGVFTPVSIGNRWLVDGALVNPVPVSAVRALGARLVIAVNLNTDLFGRGTTIANFGADEADEGWFARMRAPQGIDTPAGSAADIVKRKLIGTIARPGIATVMIEAYNVMQDRLTRARLAGDPPDITVNPPLGPIGWFDFHRAAECIDIGAKAGERALEPIEQALNVLA